MKLHTVTKLLKLAAIVLTLFTGMGCLSKRVTSTTAGLVMANSLARKDSVLLPGRTFIAFDTTQYIRFTRQTLKSVMTQLHNYYHVAYIADASIHRLKVKGRISTNYPLDIIISVLNDVSPKTTFERHQNTIFVKWK